MCSSPVVCGSFHRARLRAQGQVIFVSAGALAGASYGFYLVDQLEQQRVESNKLRPPPKATPNVPPHLRAALEGRPELPAAGDGGARPRQ